MCECREERKHLSAGVETSEHLVAGAPIKFRSLLKNIQNYTKYIKIQKFKNYNFYKI